MRIGVWNCTRAQILTRNSTHDHKTIEGDLFKAFVAAGAISKANADDPKKSSFVRCARTDKGVHAAGNVISLKLIVEDEDIVKKINDNLVPQIRVWGFERTINSFSAYQMVDSRIYEYLIPTHSFLPPHPSSFLGRALEEWAKKKDDLESYRQRQEEVTGYWEKVDKEIIEPILADYDEDIRNILQKALWMKTGDPDAPEREEQVSTDLDDIYHETEVKEPPQNDVGASNGNGTSSEQGLEGAADVDKSQGEIKPSNEADDATADEVTEKSETADGDDPAKVTGKTSRSAILQEAMKRLRQAYITAKRAYRIPKTRLDRIQDALNYYKGTRNYHNFTVQKTHDDASAKRVIKSFIVNPEPILINGTEWLSMKVHGQSFMMHQIRKMVAMVALVVRCGCDPNRINDSLGQDNISIPKAPSLGLLLERPVFDSYNRRATSEMSKEAIDFDKYKAEMDAFKQKHIYERMYEDEENMNVFGNFFNHVDNFPIETFMFVTSGGIEATKVPIRHDEKIDKEEHALVETDLGGDGDSDADDNVRDNHGDEG